MSFLENLFKQRIYFPTSFCLDYFLVDIRIFVFQAKVTEKDIECWYSVIIIMFRSFKRARLI